MPFLHVVRRVAGAIALFWLVVTLIFGLVRLAPGDPVTLLVPPTASAADAARMRSELGLDRPVSVQYARWASALLRGEMGESFALHIPVATALRDAAPVSVLLGLASLFLSFAIGVPLGFAQAAWRTRWPDRAATVVGYANNNNLNGTTATRAAFSIAANDTTLETITIRNLTPQGGSQAEAVFTGAQRVLLNRVNLLSRQDTLLTNTIRESTGAAVATMRHVSHRRAGVRAPSFSRTPGFGRSRTPPQHHALFHDPSRLRGGARRGRGPALGRQCQVRLAADPAGGTRGDRAADGAGGAGRGRALRGRGGRHRSEEHTSELQSH